MTKKFIFILFLSFTTAIIYAQNPLNKTFDGTPDGEIINYYGNGNIYTKYTVKNNNLQGTQYVYQKNGNISIIQQFDNGEFNGTNFSLNENLDTVYIEVYKHDTVLFLKNFYYYKNGKIKEIYTTQFISDSTLIKNPFRNTTTSFGNFYFNFKFLEETVSNNQTYTKFYKSGVIKSYYIAINNKINGKGFEYFKNGKAKTEAMYVNDKLNGPYIEYNTEGKIVKTSLYQDNKVVK